MLYVIIYNTQMKTDIKTDIKTLSIRVKDKHAKILSKYAFAVNQVWNEVNDLTYEAWYIPVPEVGYIKGVWLSAYDVHPLIKDYRYKRELCIPAATVQAITEEHAKARKQFKKSKLKWRTSGGSRKSLGWIPFKIGQLKYQSGQCKFNRHFIDVWDSYDLSQYEFRSGNFSEDSRGRWYLNIVVKVPVIKSKATSGVGIDLGLKTVATCSDGTKLENSKIYRNMEAKLASAQRANNKKQVKNIHAKIKNKRKDLIHKFTTMLSDKHGFIVVGDVSSSKLAKTKMSKSVLDAGWHMLKTQLKYKAIARSTVFEEVNEAYSTQTCSSCGSLPDSRPRGIAGLGVRNWKCSDCGAEHDRDINAAINIFNFAVGHGSLAEEVSV